jgi:hypothetical protein
MWQRALSSSGGGGGLTESEYFSDSFTSSQTVIRTTTKKAKGISFAYYLNGYVRFCYAYDGVDDNYLSANGVRYTTVTFSDNAITLGAGIGANVAVIGVVIY